MAIRHKVWLIYVALLICAAAPFVFDAAGRWFWGIAVLGVLLAAHRWVRCPTCRKSVFYTFERKGLLGKPLSYAHLWPERLCSRCGTVLIR